MGTRAVALIALILLAAVGTTSCETAGGGSPRGDLEWVADWSRALVEAQDRNLPIMINFYTDACPACRKMDQTTFLDTELASFLNANFVNLKNNAGKSSLHQRYGIGAVPTIIFSTPEGYATEYELSRFVGYRDAGELRQEAEAALARWQS
jgi:thiol:disulfide interchange protein